MHLILSAYFSHSFLIRLSSFPPTSPVSILLLIPFSPPLLPFFLHTSLFVSSYFSRFFSPNYPIISPYYSLSFFLLLPFSPPTSPILFSNFSHLFLLLLSLFTSVSPVSFLLLIPFFLSTSPILFLLLLSFFPHTSPIFHFTLSLHVLFTFHHSYERYLPLPFTYC